jgi:hypothetical protein
MKCPVCDSELKSNDSKCLNCGFNDLNKKFADSSEQEKWLEETVEPCRAVFEKCAGSFWGMEEAVMSIFDQFLNFVDENQKLLIELDVYRKVKFKWHDLVDEHFSKLQQELNSIQEKYDKETT